MSREKEEGVRNKERDGDTRKEEDRINGGEEEKEKSWSTRKKIGQGRGAMRNGEMREK